MVDWAGLEIRSLSQDRGFESLSLLKQKVEPQGPTFCFIRDTPNPRRGFDRRLRNEVKRSRLRFWPKARTRRAAMERSDIAVSSLSHHKEKEPQGPTFCFIRDTPNPRRGFDRRLRNEVKRSRLRFWPKARTRRAAMERSDIAVSSLSRRKEKEPQGPTFCFIRDIPFLNNYKSPVQDRAFGIMSVAYQDSSESSFCNARTSFL